MTKLDCSVNGCAYNDDNCCKLREIDVKGHEAKKSSETMCASFENKGCGCAKNSIDCVCKETEVHCDAVSCRFNQHFKCAAEHIGIADNCESKKHGTECASFACQKSTSVTGWNDAPRQYDLF